MVQLQLLSRKLLKIGSRLVHRGLQHFPKQQRHGYAFLENLNLLLSKGYSLHDSLNIMSYRFDTLRISAAIIEGAKFSEAIQHLLTNDILLIIAISEESGKLKKGIEFAYRALTEKQKRSNELSDLLKYPILMMVMITAVLFFVGTWLIPQFQTIYTQFGIELALPYQILFAVID